MGKFIKLHDCKNCDIIVNSDKINYVHRKLDDCLTEISLDGDGEKSILYVSDTIDYIYAVLTDDRKYFAEQAREIRRMEKRNKKNSNSDDIPITDLEVTHYGTVISPASSVISDNADNKDILSIQGGNFTKLQSYASCYDKDNVNISGGSFTVNKNDIYF